MNDSLSPLPLMEVKMLRPDPEFPFNASRSRARSNQSSSGLKDKPLYDRYGRYAGLTFEVPELATRGKRGTDWDATRVYLTAVFGEVDQRLNNLEAISAIGQGSFQIMLEVSARALTNPALSHLLQEQGETLRRRGARLVTSIPCGEVTTMPKAVQKSAFKSLYDLKDAGVVVAANAARYSAIPKSCKLLEHASIVVLTPKALAISNDSETFCLWKYTERISSLNYLIHEQSKTIYLKDIKNKWQLEFVNAIPIHYYGL